MEIKILNILVIFVKVDFSFDHISAKNFLIELKPSRITWKNLIFSPNIKIEKIVCAVFILQLPEKIIPQKKSKKIHFKGSYFEKYEFVSTFFCFCIKVSSLLVNFEKIIYFQKVFRLLAILPKKIIFIFV